MIRLKTLNTMMCAIAGAALSVAILSSCRAPEVQGSAEQAITTRANIEAGKQLLNTIQSEVDGIMQKLTMVPIAKDLLLDTRQGGKLVVTLSEVATNYGVYSEVTPGSFSFTPNPQVSTITVEYLNGVDLVISDVRPFEKNPTDVWTFNWNVTSNNRAILTPTAEAITIVNGTANRIVVPEEHKLILLAIQPSAVDLTGSVQYVNSAGVTVHYYINRNSGDVAVNGTTVAQSNYFKVWDVSTTPGNTTTNAKSWRSADVVVYWVGNLAGKIVVRSRTNSFEDHLGSTVDTSILYDADASSPGFAVFKGTGNATVTVTGAAAASRFPDNDGESPRWRDSDKVWVAKIYNTGVVTCDLNNPTQTATLTPAAIMLEWVDGVNDQLMPGAIADCANSIISR